MTELDVATTEPAAETTEPEAPPTPPDGAEETPSEPSEAEPVAAAPNPAEERRARALAMVARKEAKIFAQRAESDRILAEAKQLRADAESKAAAIKSILDMDDPIEGIRALGLDPEKYIFGLNERILARGTPEAKQTATERRIQELEAKLAEKEKTETQQRAEAEQQRACSIVEEQFAAAVESVKDKYPAIAKMNPQVRASRMWELANAYVSKTGQVPTYEMLADGLEYTLRSEYDQMRALFEHSVSESARAGDGLQESKPKSPKLSSVLATGAAPQTPKPPMTEDEWREQFARDFEKLRANAQR